jgi:hypothetical protein
VSVLHTPIETDYRTRLSVGRREQAMQLIERDIAKDGNMRLPADVLIATRQRAQLVTIQAMRITALSVLSFSSRRTQTRVCVGSWIFERTADTYRGRSLLMAPALGIGTQMKFLVAGFGTTW